MRLPDPALLVITDRRQARMPLADIVEAACAAGCRWFSVREKDLRAEEQIALAASLLKIARRFGARLMLHGDAELAATAGLDGVHLPSGGDVGGARALLGRGRLLGISIHNAAEAARLDPALLDYAIAGPAHETDSKPGYGPPLGSAGIAAIVSAASVRILAIGGITADSARQMLENRAAGIAVMGSVMRSSAPGEEIRRLIAALAAPTP
ncbi:MAG TPA: thiamine phosphate synthase [Xanthobacteraceae bacterium]